MTEEKSTESRVETVESSFDNLLERASDRRKESIRRSMARPLSTEMLRTSFMIACILIDILLVPGLCVSLLGRSGLVAAIVLLLPLVYLEHKAHQRWFPLPVSAKDGPEREKPPEELAGEKVP